MLMKLPSLAGCGLLIAGLATLIGTPAAHCAEAATTEATFGSLKLDVPSTWKKEAPKSRLRLGQFSIAPLKGDKDSAELAIFSFGASDVRANVRRWIGQFAAEGRKAKVTSGEATKGKYVFVEVSGTYNKPVGPPIQGKTEPTPGSRVLAVMLAVPDKGVFFLKMAGPDKTVAAQSMSLRKAFGADAAKEKEVDFE